MCNKVYIHTKKYCGVLRFGYLPTSIHIPSVTVPGGVGHDCVAHCTSPRQYHFK